MSILPESMNEGQLLINWWNTLIVAVKIREIAQVIEKKNWFLIGCYVFIPVEAIN